MPRPCRRDPEPSLDHSPPRRPALNSRPVRFSEDSLNPRITNPLRRFLCVQARTVSKGKRCREGRGRKPALAEWALPAQRGFHARTHRTVAQQVGWCHHPVPAPPFRRMPSPPCLRASMPPCLSLFPAPFPQSLLFSPFSPFSLFTLFTPFSLFTPFTPALRPC